SIRSTYVESPQVERPRRRSTDRNRAAAYPCRFREFLSPSPKRTLPGCAPATSARSCFSEPRFPPPGPSNTASSFARRPGTEFVRLPAAAAFLESPRQVSKNQEGLPALEAGSVVG